MSVQFYPNGIGGTGPDALDASRPLQTTGNVYYVSSVIGIDGGAPGVGQNREKPLATLAQAVTNASDGDIVVFLAGHTQTLTANQVINKRLTLIGEGTSGGKPAVSFTPNAAATIMFSITVANVELRNIYFPPNTVANTSPRITWGGALGRISGCYFECASADTGPALQIASTHLRVQSTTFISIASSRTAQPLVAVYGAAGSSVDDLEFDGLVVSAGTVGFSNFSAVDLSAASSAARTKGINVSLLLGADMNLGASATTTGYMNIQLATGGSRCNWT